MSLVEKDAPSRVVRVLVMLGTLAMLVMAIAACSSSSGDAARPPSSGTGSGSTATAPGTTVDRPDGPAATITGPLTGGKGVFVGAAQPAGPALTAAGYEETEYAAAGTAVSYTSAGDLPTDGRFVLEPGPSADYITRVAVRRPKDSAAFNGTVIVEWLNVSGGVDADPEYTYLAAEALREGYAWVGISAQRIGIEGGPIAVKAPGAEEGGAGKGLRAIDPDRYGSLHHPGDAYSYDLYTQVARALRSPGAIDPLAGLDVQRLLAAGESQAAFALTTYYDGVQPLTEEFDGFLIHSRGGAPAPLSTPSGAVDVATSIGGKPTILRTDLSTPVIVVQTETDVLGLLRYYPARQPDTERVRVWEVAGTAHADQFQVGDMGNAFGCGTALNDGQQVFVLRAALRHLQSWMVDGTPAPHAAPLEVDASGAAFVVDDVGNVKGGVRTPKVDAPLDLLSGLAPNSPSVLCILFGRTVPLTAEQLATTYPSRDAYLERYTKATDAAIAAGFVVPEDRQAVLDDAEPSRVTG